MICPKCGFSISDDAKFCGNCGEAIKKEIAFPEESLIISDLSDSNLTISLEEDATAVSAFINKENEFNIILNNNSSNPIYDVEVELTGPHHIYILVPSKEIREILPKTSQTISFTIIPKGTGTFNINATLKSKVGHFLTHPFEVMVEQTPIETTLPEALSTIKPPRRTEEQVTAILLVISLIAILLIIGGIPVIFNNTSGGITMIVIGLILLGIGTKGRCFYCFAVFAACDCDC
jgi:hypothetical protein